MAEYDAKFKNGQWYRLKAEPGGKFEQYSGGKKTVYFNLLCRVVGGEMAGQTIECPMILSDDTKERFVGNALVLGFDAMATDLNLMGDTVSGKEFWGKCQIQPKNDGRGNWPARIAEIVDLNARIPGGPESRAAAILGNTATKAPEKEAYDDRF